MIKTRHTNIQGEPAEKLVDVLVRLQKGLQPPDADVAAVVRTKKARALVNFALHVEQITRSQHSSRQIAFAVLLLAQELGVDP